MHELRILTVITILKIYIYICTLLKTELKTSEFKINILKVYPVYICSIINYIEASIIQLQCIQNIQVKSNNYHHLNFNYLYMENKFRNLTQG